MLRSEDQTVGDRAETEDQCSNHGDAVEVSLHNGRTGGCGSGPTTEHVGEASALPAVQQHEENEDKCRDQMQGSHEPNHCRKDTNCGDPSGNATSDLIEPVLHNTGEVISIERGSADERAIDVGLRHQFRRVPGFDRTAVLDPNRSGCFRPKCCPDAGPDMRAHLLASAGIAVSPVPIAQTGS